jgi:hypothetical protein
MTEATACRAARCPSATTYGDNSDVLDGGELAQLQRPEHLGGNGKGQEQSGHHDRRPDSAKASRTGGCARRPAHLLSLCGRAVGRPACHLASRQCGAWTGSSLRGDAALRETRNSGVSSRR